MIQIPDNCKILKAALTSIQTIYMGVCKHLLCCHDCAAYMSVLHKSWTMKPKDDQREAVQMYWHFFPAWVRLDLDLALSANQWWTWIGLWTRFWAVGKLKNPLPSPGLPLYLGAKSALSLFLCWHFPHVHISWGGRLILKLFFCMDHFSRPIDLAHYWQLLLVLHWRDFFS